MLSESLSMSFSLNLLRGWCGFGIISFTGTSISPTPNVSQSPDIICFLRIDIRHLVTKFIFFGCNLILYESKRDFKQNRSTEINVKHKHSRLFVLSENEFRPNGKKFGKCCRKISQIWDECITGCPNNFYNGFDSNNKKRRTELLSVRWIFQF